MSSAAVYAYAHRQWSVLVLVVGADDIDSEAIFTVYEFFLVVLYNNTPC